MFSRLKVAKILAELMGVIILVTAVYSMVARTPFPLFAGMAAGLTLGLLVFSIGATSGAHVNPAITLGLWSIRKVKTSTAIIYVLIQLLGGYLAFLLINYLLGRNIESIANAPEIKVFVAEAIGALIFGFGVASAIYQKYEGGKLAFAVGGSLTVGILVASLASNGVLNPAVAIGLQSWNKAYALGPIVGAIIGMNLYALLFTEETIIKRASAGNISFKNPFKRQTVATKSKVTHSSTSKKVANKPSAKKKSAAKRKR